MDKPITIELKTKDKTLKPITFETSQEEWGKFTALAKTEHLSFAKLLEKAMYYYALNTNIDDLLSTVKDHMKRCIIDKDINYHIEKIGDKTRIVIDRILSETGARIFDKYKQKAPLRKENE